jgi:hypothetical protein
VSSQASRDKQQAGTRDGVQAGGLTLSLGQVTAGPPRAWPQGRVPPSPTAPPRFAVSVRTRPQCRAPAGPHAVVAVPHICARTRGAGPPAPYSAAAVRLQPLWSPPSDRPALDLQFPHHFPPSEMTNRHTWLRRSCPYGGQSAGEDGARREEGPGSLLGTAGGISVKPEGSFAKSTMLTRSEPSISAIQRPRAARDVAFCGGRAWTPVSYCRDSVSAELKGLIVCQNMLLGHQ